MIFKKIKKTHFLIGLSIFIILTAVLTIFAISNSSSADDRDILKQLNSCETTPVEDFNYYIEGSNSVIINKYFGDSEYVVIPDKIEGIAVSEIDNSAFFGNTNLIAVKIPEGVSIIDSYAFSLCTELKAVVLPETLEIIGTGAFQLCDKLTTINLPNKIYAIGALAFSECSSLTKVVLPNSLVAINANSFNKTGLVKIKVPEGVKSVDDGAFANCANLKKVSLPSTVEYMGADVFKNSPNVKIASTNNEIIKKYLENNKPTKTSK